MVYILIAVLFVFFCGAKFVKSDEFNSDYMSKDTTGAINGIFVLLAFYVPYQRIYAARQPVRQDLA